MPELNEMSSPTNGVENVWRVRTQVLSDTTFRVTFFQGSEPPLPTLNRYGYLKSDSPEATEVRKHRDELLQLNTPRGVLEILPQEGSSVVTLRRGDGILLKGQVQHVRGEKQWRCSFELHSNEQLFGLGDQTREEINHRGTSADMWIRNVECYIPIPFLMSNRGYGVLCNTTRRHQWDLGRADTAQWQIEIEQEYLDLYFFIGDTPKEVLCAYAGLTGKPALPPKWSFGLWYLCHQQADAFEVMRTASGFRERGIPCDVIGLEPGWMDKGYDFSTEKCWHPERFPMVSHKNAINFTDALRNMGFRLELWLCNDYDLSYEAERRIQQREVASQDASAPVLEKDHVQDAHFSFPIRQDTITRPEEPWFAHLQKFVDQGASLFKQDGANQTLEHPDRLWGNRMRDDEMHNLYPLLYSQQLYDGFKNYTGRRPCCFTPNGWAGLQRYTGTWTGDTGGGKTTLIACLNLALSGHGLVTCDMKVGEKAGIHYGFLLPWAQVNSFAYFEQPWYLGDELYPVFCDYARLRSQLVPYLYSASYDAHQTGVPMLRPLLLEFPEDKQAAGVLSQYFLGNTLMVTAFEEEVYLPDGQWFDFWTGVRLTGPQSFSYRPPENRGGGLFVRGNSILPLAPVTQYVGQKAEAGMTLHIYLDTGNAAEAMLFDDDGITFNYKNGDYTLHKFAASYAESVLTVEVPDSIFVGTILAHLDTEPRNVRFNGEEATFKWDADRRVADILLPQN